MAVHQHYCKMVEHHHCIYILNHSPSAQRRPPEPHAVIRRSPAPSTAGPTGHTPKYLSTPVLTTHLAATPIRCGVAASWLVHFVPGAGSQFIVRSLTPLQFNRPPSTPTSGSTPCARCFTPAAADPIHQANPSATSSILATLRY